MNIKLHSIARQKTVIEEMEELFASELAVGTGLKGDQSVLCTNGEVAVLSRESWVKVCHETETELSWLLGGAHLLIKGFEFLPTDLGRSLRIGEAVLEITREIDPRHHLADDAPDVFEALQLGWRGGVVCKVLRSGEIQSGDKVDIVG